METLDGGRLGIAAQAVGIADAAFDEARARLKERRQFGRTLEHFQGLRWKAADMWAKVEAARSSPCMRPACATGGKGSARKLRRPSSWHRKRPCGALRKPCRYAAAAAIYKDLLADAWYRDAKITQIYEGTSEVQRMVIASGVLG